MRNPDGTPVEGLTADDFVVTEDNEPQDIAFVEYQRLDNLQPLPLPPMETLQVAERRAGGSQRDGGSGAVDRHAGYRCASVRRRDGFATGA